MFSICTHEKAFQVIIYSGIELLSVHFMSWALGGVLDHLQRAHGQSSPAEGRHLLFRHKNATGFCEHFQLLTAIAHWEVCCPWLDLIT